MGGKRLTYLGVVMLLLVPYISFSFVQSTERHSSIIFLHLDASAFPIDLKINSQGSADLTFQQTRDAIVASMERWANISTSKINFTNSTTSISTTGNDGNFLLVFNEGSTLGASTIATALITYSTLTGRIVDTDIEFNGNNFNFNVDGTNGGSNFDIESVASHEIGHLLGLDHATIGNDVAGINVPEDIRPTMYPFAFSSGTKGRSLEKDDIAGASFIYPEESFYTSFGAVKGNITRNNGSSIFGANVVAINLSNNATISSLSGYSTNKGGKGEYLIIGLESGNYTIALEPLPNSASDTDEGDLAGIFSSFDTDFSSEFYNNRPNFVDGVKVSINGGQNLTGINFVVGNAAPTVLNVTITSTDSLNRTNGSLIGSFVFNDSDFSDVNLANETIWYNNSIEISSFRNLTNISSYNLSKGQNWTFSIRVFDGTSYSNFVNTTITIKNAAPTQSAPILNTSLGGNNTDEELLCFNQSLSDIDGDNIFIEILWFNNSQSVADLTNKTNITSGNTSIGQNWTCQITPTDGEAIGISLNSSTMRILGNTSPLAENVNIISTDFLNRTNGTLIGNWTFSDLDGGTQHFFETKWYVNGTENIVFSNLTTINSTNTTKLEKWILSVRVFDGSNWSGFVNSSNITILNAAPIISSTNGPITVQETQLVNISISAFDLDEDILNFTLNRSEFLISNNTFLWFTNLASSGIYTLNITANDSAATDSIIANITIINERDLDNDGNPDFNETDDDNDGVLDENDFVMGNLSSINTTLPINLTINGSSGLAKLFNGTFTVTLTNGSDPFMEFNFTFNSSNVLDFGNLTINRTTNGSSAVSIRGKLNLFNYTKTVFLEKSNATVKAVCIKDADAGFDAISSACDGANETLLTCDNTTRGQYTCLDTGSRYKITGLNHSAIKEQCRDIDGDGYGEGCSAGTDCNDNDASKTTSCSSGSSGSSSSGGGGGGGGGSGGGGGLFFVCNMEWKCGEWSSCLNGFQTRKCEYVKVPQHTSDVQCQSLVNPPTENQKCESQQIALAAETCNDNIENQDEEKVDCGGICEPCAPAISNTTVKNEDEQSQASGFAVKKIVTQRLNLFITMVILVSIALSLFIWRKSRGN